MLNTLTNSLVTLCRGHVLVEKWLLAPSLRVGHEWIEAATRRTGQAIVNARVKTLESLALELASPAMARLGVRLVSPQGEMVLIDQVWGRRARSKRARGYLFSLNPSAGLFRSLLSSLRDLRLGGLDADGLPPESFEVAAKGEELRLLASDFRTAMRKRGWVDYAEVLRLATAALRSAQASLPADGLLIIPEDLSPTALEQAMLEAVPARNKLALPVDRPAEGEGPTGGATTDLECLRWLLRPLDAPAAKRDGAVQIFHAVGEVNEVRTVLRRCLAGRIRLDDIEVLHTDAEVYVPLIYETALRLAQEGGPREGGFPVTFSEGLPVRYSRPGRALQAWLSWIRDGYPQASLVRMLRDGLLVVPAEGEERTGGGQLANLLRTVPILQDRERYLAKVDEAIAAAEKRAKENGGKGEFDEDGEAVPATRAQWASARIARLKVLRSWTERLLAVTPDAGAEPADVLGSALEFLGSFARSIDEFDNFSRLGLEEQISELRTLVSEDGVSLGIDVWDWLASLPRTLRVGGSGPRPGAIHVANVVSGGHSGRGHTFVVGLDDTRFPGAGLPDPILLDGERIKLSPALSTASGDLTRKLEDFGALLARLRGSLTLSFPSRSLDDDRESFPGLPILQAFRILSGKKDGTQGDLLNWLGPAASFAPTSADLCLDPNEWWLWRQFGPEPAACSEEVLRSAFPHLGRGIQASRMRAAREFGEFDGHVDQAGRDADPGSPTGPVLSASRLECLGACPLRYFFKYILEIESPEEIEVDPERWLDPLQTGSLLHEVFHDFLVEVGRRKLSPSIARDRGPLAKILDAAVVKYRAMTPPPSEQVFRRERANLERAAVYFLAGEERHSRDYEPVCLEAAIGLPPTSPGTLLDVEDPVALTLPGGKTIRVRGRLDRVDRRRTEPLVFTVLDYKTGSTWKYDQERPFFRGRVVQHALYVSLAGRLLKTKVDPKAVVERFQYFFPGARAHGERIEYAAEDLGDGQRVLLRLVQVASSGAFLPTNDAKDCRFCDYACICGDPDDVVASSGAKLAHRDGSNAVLDPFRELRTDGQSE